MHAACCGMDGKWAGETPSPTASKLAGPTAAASCQQSTARNALPKSQSHPAHLTVTPTSSPNPASASAAHRIPKYGGWTFLSTSQCDAHVMPNPRPQRTSSLTRPPVTHAPPLRTGLVPAWPSRERDAGIPAENLRPSQTLLAKGIWIVHIRPVETTSSRRKATRRDQSPLVAE